MKRPGLKVGLGTAAVLILIGAACAPAPAPAPEPDPALECSSVTGKAPISTAGLSPAVAAQEAADAVEEAEQTEADEDTLVTVESTPEGLKIETHDVSSPEEAAAVAAEVALGNDLIAVDTDAPVQATATPNDPRTGEQWAFAKTSFGSLWPATTGTGATIAVIDTGVDASHPDLAGQVLAGWTFLYPTDEAGAPDGNGHGTHVAGIAAAATNNSQGIRGAAPGAKILPVRALDSNGSGYLSDVAAGIIWAADNGATVVNMSLGGSSTTSPLEIAIEYANDQGVVVVAAAGNDGYAGNPTSYPGASPGVIGVGAVDSGLNRAGFSTCGSYVDIAAPGVGILSTTGGGYASWSGTSMATPFVAAAAALVESARPACTPVGTANRLTTSATDKGTAGYDPYYGNGVVDPAGAISVAGC